jgi:hypothetical protein
MNLRQGVFLEIEHDKSNKCQRITKISEHEENAVDVRKENDTLKSP